MLHNLFCFQKKIIIVQKCFDQVLTNNSSFKNIELIENEFDLLIYQNTQDMKEWHIKYSYYLRNGSWH